MKRLTDFDEHSQAIPKARVLVDKGTGIVHTTGIVYVRQEEFLEMQEDLRKQLEKQATILEELLIELRQSKLHLAAMSGEDIELEDTEDD